ncbi:putative multi-domain containing protein [Aduncisulcus paluster]|uniref:Inosine triphosphate pyrophosphatase n=1 Tax=Aduncisulcus paluster TaxID=2918883 RepID=A0ABQ5K0N8_9EUKA|nr:putative multi-domain containing protein [Aduncisulcus paluster]
MTKPLALITGNINKVKEVKRILASDDSSIDLINVKLDVPEIQGTYEEVVMAKAAAAAVAYDGPVIVDDTSLCFTSWKGLPGPYIKDFITRLGPSGLAHVLDGFEDRSATAVASFAYCAGPGEEVKLFIGKCDGSITKEAHGSGFGWDPVFLPKGKKQTYAEMPGGEKDAISHRGKAVRLLCEFLKTL